MCYSIEEIIRALRPRRTASEGVTERRRVRYTVKEMCQGSKGEDKHKIGI